jgi:hypothetical protein
MENQSYLGKMRLDMFAGFFGVIITTRMMLHKQVRSGFVCGGGVKW